MESNTGTAVLDCFQLHPECPPQISEQVLARYASRIFRLNFLLRSRFAVEYRKAEDMALPLHRWSGTPPHGRLDQRNPEILKRRTDRLREVWTSTLVRLGLNFEFLAQSHHKISS